MKDHTSCSDNFDKHNKITVRFEPCELIKESDISIDMGYCNCSTPSPSGSSSGTNSSNDSTLILILVALLASYLNRGDLEF